MMHVQKISNIPNISSFLNHFAVQLNIEYGSVEYKDIVYCPGIQKNNEYTFSGNATVLTLVQQMVECVCK